MADTGFDFRSQKPKRLVEFDNLKIGIVSKPVFSVRFGQNPSVADAAGSGDNFSLGVRQRHKTAIMRSALVAGFPLENFQQHGVVVVVGRMDVRVQSGGVRQRCVTVFLLNLFQRGVSSGIHARLVFEGIDNQAAVFRQNPLIELNRLFRRLFVGVFRKRQPVLDNLNRILKIAQRLDLNLGIAEQLFQLCPLFEVVGTQNQN